MAIFNREISLNDLIKVTTGGVSVADPIEIKNSLIRLMKNIYGNDIDISDESSDGKYIYQLTLLINNILNLTKYAFQQLNPQTASGNYLDILCSYSNVERIQKSSSKAQVWIKNISGSDQQPDIINFIDINNNYWEWKNKKEITIKNDEVVLLTDVMCKTLGKIQALGNHVSIDQIDWSVLTDNNRGSIYRTVSSYYEVYQNEDAEVGNELESDNSLRSRRNQSSGLKSVSVLTGLESSLINVDGIKDSLIYNNVTESSGLSITDLTKIDLHDVYILLRYENNANIPDYVIGELIYNKLTPGVKTTPYLNNVTSTSLLDHKPTGISKKYEIAKSGNLKYNLYWKRCYPFQLYPESGNNTFIKFKLNLISDIFNYPEGYSTAHLAKSLVEKNICNNIVNHLNNIKLGDYLYKTKLNSVIQDSDILNNGFHTFVVDSNSTKILENDSISKLDLENTYLDFNETSVIFEYSNLNTLYVSVYQTRYLADLNVKNSTIELDSGESTTFTLTQNANYYNKGIALTETFSVNSKDENIATIEITGETEPRTFTVTAADGILEDDIKYTEVEVIQSITANGNTYNNYYVYVIKVTGVEQ